MKFLEPFFTSVLIACLVALVVYLGFMGTPLYYRVQKQAAERDELAKSVARIRMELADYQHRQDRFETDAAYVERVARESGRVVPNEIVFVVE
ncbi:MAG: FtsB family cell division protein [Kiritimatiellia bacterium]